MSEADFSAGQQELPESHGIVNSEVTSVESNLTPESERQSLPQEMPSLEEMGLETPSIVAQGDDQDSLPNDATATVEVDTRYQYLLSRVAQLETVLNECQASLEVKSAQLHHQEAQITQQTHELAVARDHIARLLLELETSHQVAQRQQILIETVTHQLESSQERIAQLERECSVGQHRFEEQAQQLLHAENTCQDLRARLHRQQHYTLQFKAALEKCLELPTYRYGVPVQNLQGLPLPQVSLPPINSKDSWPDSALSFEFDTGNLLKSFLEVQSGFSDWGSLEEAEEPSTDASSCIPQETYESVPEADPWQSELTPVEILAEVAPPSILDSPEVIQPSLLLEAASLPPAANSAEVNPVAASPTAGEAGIEQSSLSWTLATNWPSPLVYPDRPPKKRKTSVELPMFLRRLNDPH